MIRGLADSTEKSYMKISQSVLSSISASKLLSLSTPNEYTTQSLPRACCMRGSPHTYWHAREDRKDDIVSPSPEACARTRCCRGSRRCMQAGHYCKWPACEDGAGCAHLSAVCHHTQSFGLPWTREGGHEDVPLNSGASGSDRWVARPSGPAQSQRQRPLHRWLTTASTCSPNPSTPCPRRP